MTKKIPVSQYIQYVEVVLKNIPLQNLYAENLKKYVKTEILKIFIYLFWIILKTTSRDSKSAKTIWGNISTNFKCI